MLSFYESRPGNHQNNTFTNFFTPSTLLKMGLLSKSFASRKNNFGIRTFYGHIPKLFFRDADDFNSKTPSSNVEGVIKLVNVVLW